MLFMHPFARLGQRHLEKKRKPRKHGQGGFEETVAYTAAMIAQEVQSHITSLVGLSNQWMLNKTLHVESSHRK